MSERNLGQTTDAPSRFSASELALMLSLIATWVGITIQLGWFSVFFWGCGIAMTRILCPAHQRRRVPDSVTDALSVAVCWAVAWGAAGVTLDWRMVNFDLLPRFSWTVLGELTGFYLGLVWVLVLLLVRHVERLTGQFERPRPAA